MSVVVDASCFAALFLPDEDSALVERYLDQAETVAAPKLAIVVNSGRVLSAHPQGQSYGVPSQSSGR